LARIPALKFKGSRAKLAKNAKNFLTDENSIATSVVNCALEIHKELGPGLLESVYEVLLADSLTEWI
jgi:hypothetical protein